MTKQRYTYTTQTIYKDYNGTMTPVKIYVPLANYEVPDVLYELPSSDQKQT